MDKIESLEEQLVESKTEVVKLTSVKIVFEFYSKEKDFYIPPFKRNNEELKAKVARIDKSKKSSVDAEVSKPMPKTPSRLKEKSKFFPTCHHCQIVGHIRPNCLKLRSLSTSKVRPPLGSLVVLKLLIFVTIGVLLVTLTLIILKFSPISECPIGLILYLKALYLFLVIY